MIVFGFDCDYTLETSNGLVPISVLYWLINKGHYVFIVSPSPNCSRIAGVPRYAPLLPRWMILDRIKKSVKADRYVYVGDTLNDLKTAQIANWEFNYPQEFIDNFT